MKINQEFIVARPVPAVWEFFKDVPRVASCLPGAEYTGSPKEGSYTGKVTSKLGPFSASFEGEATVTYDDAAKTVRADGKGVDRKGNSRSKMGLDCRLLPEGESTKVIVDADIQLSGAIAQFGRTGLIDEVAKVLIGDFVKNAESELSEKAPPAANDPTASSSSGKSALFPSGSAMIPGEAVPILQQEDEKRRAQSTPKPAQASSLSAGRLLWLGIKSWFRSLFRKSA